MQTPEAQQDASRLTIYYDGSCPLCTTEIRHYARQDGAERLCFVDAASAKGQLAPDLDRDAALARFHVRRPDGTLVSGAAGFTEVWKVLPRWNWAARLARLPGVPILLEGAYRAFLPVRPWLARTLGPWLARDGGPRE